MEKLCGRVRSADADALETLVQPIRDRASTAIQEFLQMHADVVNRPSFHETIGTDFHETLGTDSDKLHSMCFSVCLCFMKLIKMCVCVFFKEFSLSCDGLGYGETGVSGSSVTQTQLLLPEIPSEQNAAESWDTLAEVAQTNTYKQINIFEYKTIKRVYVCLGPAGIEWFSGRVLHNCSCEYHKSIEISHSLFFLERRERPRESI